MTSSKPSHQGPNVRRSHRAFDLLPREHGFWVMLIAALLCAVLQSPRWELALLVSTASGALGAFGGGIIRRRIRRSGVAQLASAMALGLVGIPAAVVGGVTLQVTIATAAAWIVIFGSSAGLVRACFARARGQATRALAVEALAVALTGAAAAAFWTLDYPRQALACALVCLSALGVAAWRPGVKQLKPVGLALAGIALLAVAAIAA